MYGYFFATAFTGNFQDVQDLVDAGNLGVRFAAECYGAFRIFAALEGDTVGDLETAGGRIDAVGAGGSEVVQGLIPSNPQSPSPNIAPPKHVAVQDNEGFVRVELDGDEADFLVAAAGVDNVIGAAITEAGTGGYVAVVEVGASTFLDVTTALAEVYALPDVTGHLTAVAYLG